MDIVVVDNGSTDRSVEMLAERWPDVRLIANEDNLGFTRANNQAFAVAHGDVLLLINADARVEPGCIDALLSRLDDAPRAAIVGPRLVYGDGSWQRWTAGRAPSLSTAATHFLFLDRILRRHATAPGIYLSRDIRTAFEPDWVSSACFALRRSALEEIGGMDERFFCYMDDVDICQRARDHGWQVWYEPAATAVHLMGQSTRRVTGAASPLALQNFNRYFVMRHGRLRGGMLRVLEAVGFGARVLVYGADGILRRRPAARSQAGVHWRHLRITLSTRGP